MSEDDRRRATRGPRRPWYADGLRFTCRPDCGRCCTRHDDYAYVYLDRGDVARLAALFEITTKEFRARFTKRDDGHTVLLMDEAACPFLDGARCSVYAARPGQCRSFPFWPENLTTETRWRRLAEFCPGIGEGDVVPLHVIRDRADGRSES